MILRALSLPACLCLLSPVPLHSAKPSAPAWAPIPAEVWAMKEDPAKGWKDAVILEKETRIEHDVLQVLLRVRILSQAGKDTAGLLPLQEGIEDVSGRVVHRNGQIIPFRGKGDCQQVTVKGPQGDAGYTRIIPPGLNDDCVLEVWWNEKAVILPTSWGAYHIYRPGGAFATLEERIHLGRDCYFGLVEMLKGSPWQPKFTRPEADARLYVFKDLPPFTPEPFSLEVQRRRPELVFFYFPFHSPIHGDGIGTPHWQRFARAYFKPVFQDDVKTGRSFKALAERILPQLKDPSPGDRARRLVALLEREFMNLGNLTHQESSRRDKFEKTPEPWDLEAGVDQGAFTPYGMRILAFRLLSMAGMSPKLVLTADREDHLISPAVTAPYQFDAQYLAIPEGKESYCFIDPGRRFAPPGMIAPSHQGALGLLLDPDQGWKQTLIDLPAPAAEGNRTRYVFRIQAGDGQDRFQAAASFSGWPEHAERNLFFRLEQAEQDRSLRTRLESRLRSATFSRAQVLHATDPKFDVSWEAEGLLDVEAEGRQRRILPFPGLPVFLDPPDYWPEKRVLPIVMPCMQLFEVESSITLPVGCQPLLPEPLEQSNRFGKVTWKAQALAGAEGTNVKVRMECSLTALMAPPEAQEDLKTWFAWIREARERTIGLEKRP